MTLASMAALGPLADHLLRASVHGGLFVLGVLALTRMLPDLPPRLRAVLWWLACARFLVGLAWVSPFALPVLPASAPVAAASPAMPSRPDVGILAPVAQSTAVVFPAQSVGSGSAAVPDWRAWAAVAWVGLVLAALLRTVAAARRTRRLLASAEAADARVTALAADAASRVGLRTTPPVLVSDGRVAPQVIWIGRPRVLLAREHVQALGDAQLRMLLGHELSHVARRDGWWACVPSLAHHLFVFHPLAHLAGREFAVAREAACDAEVMARFDAPGADYGHLLVRLGVVSPRPTLATAGTPHSVSALKRRLIMLSHWTPSTQRITARAALALAVCLIAMIPVTLVQGAAKPAAQPPDQRHARTARDADRASRLDAAAVPEPELEPLEAESRAEWDQVPPPPPPPPPPAPPAPPAPPDPGLDHLFVKGQRVSAWSFVSPQGNVSMHVNMDGRRATAGEQRQPGFRFEYGGRTLVIDDGPTLAAIQQVFAPVTEIGNRQGELGGRQGALGEQQAALGERQAALAAKQAALAVKHAEAAARQAEVAAREMARASRARQSGEPPAASVPQTREMELAGEELERAMDRLGDQQEELGRQQEALGKEQERFGRQQEALAREMAARNDKVLRELSAVLERAIDAGVAKPAAK